MSIILNTSNFSKWSRIIQFNVTVAGMDFNELLNLSPRKNIFARAVKDNCLIDRALVVYVVRTMDETLCSEYSDLKTFGTLGIVWDSLVARFGTENHVF